jgi:ATP-dependent Lhr-like helicase
MQNPPDDMLVRIETWFASRGWTPSALQRQAWQAYLAGESGLIHAPTGTGKTLAALLGPVLATPAETHNTPAAPPSQLLWVTPLRALAADTTENLQAALTALNLPWSVERRTGDTSQSVRNRQRRRLPSVLVTTPESLSLLLSYPDTQVQFAKLRCVVVDEWHELLGSKRGVQLELCIAHLRSLQPALRIWGLSATLGNMKQAMDVLLGPDHQGRLISDNATKTVRIRSVIPENMERFPWVGHLGLGLLPAVIQVLEKAGTTLLFTNTRAQAELWYQGLLVIRRDWEGDIALHHGSIDRKLRLSIEERLRTGSVRCVVCTSSLDLGVDFSPVDQVIQVGSPKGAGRLLQRAGRSGHRPGVASEILCVPTHAFELVEIAAVRRALASGRIEAREPLQLSLDVLTQHLVTLALGGGFDVAEVRQTVQGTYAFQDLTEQQWRWALDFLTRGGDALQHYPQYHRVVLKDGRYCVEDRRIARLHRMAIGTITSDSVMQVRLLRGPVLGSLDEAFIARLQPREPFLFAGRLLELVRIRDMTAYVRLAKKRSTHVPRWTGSRLPLSGTLADEILALLHAGDADVSKNSPELEAVVPLLAVQKRWSALPAPDVLLVEQIRSREGAHLFIYPFAGRLVHEGLAVLLAYRLAQQAPLTFTLACNDYGLELLTASSLEMDEQRLRDALDPTNLSNAILASLNTSELAKRQFRDIARIAGLVFQGYPGQGKSTRQIQASSGLIYEVLKDYDKTNLLLDQAEQEVLQRQLEIKRLQQALIRISSQELHLVHPAKLTPLAFPLWAERLQFQVSSESWKDRVQRMVVQLERAADGPAKGRA